MSYEAFRHFADSYWLALMVLCFAIFVGWALLPGQRAKSDAAARSIFDEDQQDG